MANSYISNPIVLDTFTSAINVNSSMGFAAGTPLKVISIEWQTPTNTAHAALISDDAGVPVFSERCTVENQSVMKYFETWVSNLKIAVSGVGSGKISILFA